MAQTKRSAKLDSRSVRLRLPAGDEKQTRVAPGQYIVYRKPNDKSSGKWTALWYDPQTKARTKHLIGVADDYRDADGITILSYEQAQARAVEWFQQQEKSALEADGEIINNGSLTVSDALNAYFQNAERRGMKAVSRAIQSANAWIVQPLGSIEISKLTRAKIEKWLDSVAKSPRRLRTKPGKDSAFGAEPVTEEAKRARKASANRVLTILKAALNFALDRRLINSSNPCWQQVKPYRETVRARTRFLTVEEQVRLVNVCPPDFKKLVRGALLTGCRYSELARIKCKDYNPNTEVPTVFIAESKNGKSRYVFLTDEGIKLFDELTASDNPESYVFTRDSTARRSRGDLENTWGHSEQKRFMMTACKAAGVQVTFHELRHTYASMLVNSRCPLPVVAQQLGHSDTRMVEKHYGHLAPSYVADMVKATMPTLGILEPAKIQKLKLS
jgi:integrase